MEIYLPEKKARQRLLKRRIKLLSVIFLAIVICGATIYWLFFSEFWNIKDFEFRSPPNKLKSIAEEEILQKVKEKISGNSLLFWPSGAIILDDLPLLASIEVSKNYFKRTITISVQERESAGVWCNHWQDGTTKCFWFDEEGIIFDEAPRPNGGLIVVVDDYQENLEIQLGQTIFDNDAQTNFTKIINSWLVKEAIIHNVIIDRDRQELKLQTAYGSSVLLSYRFDPLANLNALKQLQDEKKIDLRNLQYIDLRVENRIYYK